MGHEPRRRRSRPRRRRRRSACRPRTSSAPIARSSPRRRPCSRATDVCRPQPTSTGRSSTTGTARSPAQLDAVARERDGQLPSRVDETRRSTPPAASCVRALGDGGWLRYAVPRPTAARSSARRPLAVPDRARRSPTAHALADFAFAMQGLGSGAISLFGSDGAASSATCPRSPPATRIAAFALSEPEAGSDVARDATTAAAATAASRARRRRRPGSRTAASPTSTSSSPATGEARRRAGSAPSSSTPTRRACDGRGAHRGDRAASAAHAGVRRLPRRRATQLLGEPGEGLQRRAGARSTSFAPSVGAAALGIRPPGVRRGGRARAAPRSCSASRWPSSS